MPLRRCHFIGAKSPVMQRRGDEHAVAAGILESRDVLGPANAPTSQ